MFKGSQLAKAKFNWLIILRASKLSRRHTTPLKTGYKPTTGFTARQALSIRKFPVPLRGSSYTS